LASSFFSLRNTTGAIFSGGGGAGIGGGLGVPRGQGLTLVHLSAQRKRFCRLGGALRGCLWDVYGVVKGRRGC
jgi:hypothetical protein